MNLYQKFRIWLSLRWPLILFVTFLGFISVVQAWLEKPQSSIVRTIGYSTQPLDVLWHREDISTLTVANGTGLLFSMPFARDSLIAIDIKDGSTLWKVKLSFEHSGVRRLHANNNGVFVITTTHVDAYDATTGQLRWSTKLGDGHVTIVSQLDLHVLRVYYGEVIYELDLESGKILADIPKNRTVWVTGNIVLETPNAHQLFAYDKKTSELLWNKDYFFYIDNELEPKDLDSEVLIIPQEPSSSFLKGICALDIHTGEYDWCRSESFNSMMAIYPQAQLGYIMRDDFVMLTIDLKTGDLLGETSFFANELNEEQVGSVSSITVGDGAVVITFSDSGQTFAIEFR